jgi:hypothetical protein
MWSCATQAPESPCIRGFRGDDPMEQLHIIGGLRWLRDESCRPVRYGRLRRNAQKTHETVSSGDPAGGVTRIWAPMRARIYVQHGSAFSAENQGKAPSAQHNSELHITTAHSELPFPASVVITDALKRNGLPVIGGGDRRALRPDASMPRPM